MSDFEIGSEVIFVGARMRVLDQPYGGMITVAALHAPDKPQRVPVKDVLQAPKIVHSSSDVDAAEWHELERRANAARYIMAAETKERRKALYQQHEQELGISLRTLQRAIRKLSHVNAISALQAGKSGRPIGLRMLHRDVEDIISRQLEEQWLTREQPNLSCVIAQIQSECRGKNLPEPCGATVRKRAAALDVYRTTVLRQGAKRAKYKLKAMVGHINAALAMEMVQIDHTLADAILVSEVDRTIPIGRPWVTLAIDVASRMVVGVYVSFEPPSATSVGMCLANAMLPKEHFLQQMGLKGRWPVSGMIRCIHTDNGRDFHSEALQRGCSELGIDLQYRPVGSPHYGGIIERLIGTLMGRCRLLPGATQSNVVRRDDYDSEGKAAMTLREFRAFLVNEIVNVYHVTEHRTLGVPPLAKWDELQSSIEQSSALPAGWDKWMLETTFLPYEERLIRRTGIQMFNRFYWADGLEEWIGDGIKRKVSYDPGDISKVFIIGPNGQILTAHDTSADARQISIYEYREEQRRKSGVSRSDAILNQLDEGLSGRDRMVRSAKKATKRAHREAAIAADRHRRSQSRPAPTKPSNAAPAATAPHPTIDFTTSISRLPVRRKGA